MELSEKELKIELQSCCSIRKYLEQQLESVIARTGTVQENLRLATEKKKGIKRKSTSSSETEDLDVHLSSAEGAPGLNDICVEDDDENDSSKMIPLIYSETSSSSNKCETEILDGDGEMKNSGSISSTNNISNEDRVRSEISEKRHNAMETLRFKATQGDIDAVAEIERLKILQKARNDRKREKKAMSISQATAALV